MIRNKMGKIEMNEQGINIDQWNYYSLCDSSFQLCTLLIYVEYTPTSTMNEAYKMVRITLKRRTKGVPVSQYRC